MPVFCATRSRRSSIRANTSVALARPRFTMKFPCRRLTTASPRASPLPPQSSTRRPAERPSESSGSGFLKMHPADHSVTGWTRFFSSRYSRMRSATSPLCVGVKRSTAATTTRSPR